MKQTFPKKEHLKRKKILDKLFAEKNKISAYPLLLFYLETSLPEEEVQIQAGVSVAKRNHKLAVTRNRIKRLMRERLKNFSLLKMLKMEVLKSGRKPSK